MKDKSKLIFELKNIVGGNYIITSEWGKEPFSKGWRYGDGNALAVVKPGKLIEIWEILKLCVENELIILMQAANTGLTGGSTPNGNDYDRQIIIINTTEN
jgi:D-lactate dehydrogenase